MNFDTSATDGFIDLRSDTVTRPTASMRAAMAEAVVGDDQNCEDPTVNELECRSAEIMGKEAAVFVTSGVLGNLASMLAHGNRGEEIIVGDQSHILWYEGAGAAAVGGITPRTVATLPDGTLPLDQVEATIRQAGPGYPPTAAIAIENTHNRCGGTVLPIDYLADLKSLASQNGLPVHMDGARVFNAAAALNVDVKEIARHADSVQFCFSKGLGAPVGSMVVGSVEFIARVRTHRKTLGGAMRQAGVIAAPALVALDEMIDRLPEDHARARALAETIAEYPAYRINLDSVQSNLVIFRTVKPQDEVVAGLKQRGILASNMGAPGIRLVTHHHITDEDIAKTIDALKDIAHA